jgi:hypothetical protein
MELRMDKVGRGAWHLGGNGTQVADYPVVGVDENDDLLGRCMRAFHECRERRGLVVRGVPAIARQLGVGGERV